MAVDLSRLFLSLLRSRFGIRTLSHLGEMVQFPTDVAFSPFVWARIRFGMRPASSTIATFSFTWACVISVGPLATAVTAFLISVASGLLFPVFGIFQGVSCLASILLNAVCIPLCYLRASCVFQNFVKIQVVPYAGFSEGV